MTGQYFPRVKFVFGCLEIDSFPLVLSFFQFWFIMKDSNGLRNKRLCIEGPKDLGKPGEVKLKNCNAGVENQVFAFLYFVLFLTFLIFMQQIQ